LIFWVDLARTRKTKTILVCGFNSGVRRDGRDGRVGRDGRYGRSGRCECEVWSVTVVRGVTVARCAN
jgi:hypothetical protein